jgi:hypothetical protein
MHPRHVTKTNSRFVYLLLSIFYFHTFFFFGQILAINHFLDEVRVLFLRQCLGTILLHELLNSVLCRCASIIWSIFSETFEPFVSVPFDVELPNQNSFKVWEQTRIAMTTYSFSSTIITHCCQYVVFFFANVGALHICSRVLDCTLNRSYKF